jgi:cyclic pyranopterin phosphate synthase
VPLLDRIGRPLRTLRISVTDRCNLRCSYCMPEEEYAWLPRDSLLTFEELSSLADVFLGLGVETIRLTGGEPLQRAGLPTLVRMLADKPALRDLALTTNGVMLADRAADLRAAGLHRLTVSLDTRRPDRFRAITGRDALSQVLAGLGAAARAGFSRLKIDAVILRGTNDDELADLIEFGKEIGAEVRFIEYMDVGGATRWSPDQVMSRAHMLADLERRYGPIEPAGPRGSEPAERFRLPDGTTFGIIASTTEPFCRACDRGRLTADGTWYQCLYARAGTDLRALVRGGAGTEAIAAAITQAWQGRSDRGAEERLATVARGPIVPVEALRRDPRLEMHTRGG